MALTTDRIMELALELAGIDAVPADSGIHVPCDNVRKVLVGIDIGTDELLLAKQLGCDLALGHHPSGGSTSLNFYQVIDHQIGQMMSVGVSEADARAAIAELVDSRWHVAHGSNYDRQPSFARALGMPYMNVHLPCDIIGRVILDRAAKSLLKDGKGTVQDVIDGLAGLPEYDGDPAQPVCVVGDVKNPAGLVFTATAGGTNGGYNVASTYFKHGVDTLLYFHLAYDNLKKLREANLEGKNLIILGHMPADRAGINPLLAAMEKEGAEIIRISGM